MRPVTETPDIHMVLGGLTIDRADLARLVHVRITEKLSHPAQCEVVFLCADPAFADRYPCPVKSPLTVFVNGSLFPLFNGTVTATEYAYDPEGILTLRVRGYDALYSLAKNQKIHTHLNVTVPEMARDMVKETGLSVSAVEEGPVWRQLVQYRETDLDFLARTAQRSGLYFTVNRAGVLEIMALSGNGDIVPLTRGTDLFELAVEMNDAPAIGSVFTGGWDPFLVEYHDGKAQNGDGDYHNRKLTDIPVRNTLEAETVAKAESSRLKAHEILMRGVAEGNVRLAPGCTVVIGNIHLFLPRSAVVTEAVHTISAESGFLSEFTTVPPDFRQPDSGTSATFGRVTDIGDPERLGRVRAVLPSFENAETDWMNVVFPGAGEGKGAVLLPDVDDQVLILFLNNDPGRGVVLGGVFGSGAKPSDFGIDKGEVKRFSFTTPGGQKFTLDDKRKGIKAENYDGSYVELYPGKVTIHSETDLLIQAPRKNITVLGDTIDFKKG
jgi:phage baseplate assembly protein gpV